MKKYYRVKEASALLDISPSTVRKYANEGKIDFVKSPAGEKIFYPEHIEKFLGVKTAPIYAFYVRSSSGNKELMSAQVQELTAAYGKPEKIYKDAGSGLNENRPGLAKLLRDAEKGMFNTVAVTYEDRLSRFGVSYIKKILEKDRVKVVSLRTAPDKSLEQELMDDFMSLIASISGKFYRLRSKENKKRLLDRAQKELDNG